MITSKYIPDILVPSAPEVLGQGSASYPVVSAEDQGCSVWNNLPEEITQVSSLSIFKSLLRKPSQGSGENSLVIFKSLL